MLPLIATGPQYVTQTAPRVSSSWCCIARLLELFPLIITEQFAAHTISHDLCSDCPLTEVVAAVPVTLLVSLFCA